MKEHDWKTIESIYEKALVIKPDEQDEFIKSQSKGNQAIYQQVSNMLKLDDNDDFMSGIPTEISSDAFQQQQNVNQIGHFEILEKIAVGGMGIVYKAQSNLSDVHIVVALKTIRTEIKNQDMESRFFNEKTILSKLTHKNIAHLIDAGMTKMGVTYIATQWIDGDNIISYCDKNSLNLKARLELFQQLCSAVIYAHNQLIIHRDIKPANILIDENGQVKLLDFGIAKLIDEENLNNTHTQIFTPNYAAPEQINGETSSVVTDVYALGVLLFELLTSQKRFVLDDLTITERIDLICRPTIINASKNLSKNHPIPASKLKGALNTIINKAMHVDQDRRYESVASLLDDINRYINNRPIKAIKDNWVYRGSMFIKRNKWSSIMALGVLISLSSGMIISLHQTNIANKEVQKSKQLHEFFNKSLQSASPLKGGSTTISVREMFTSGAENFNLNTIDNPLTRAEIAAEIALIFAELEEYSLSKKFTQSAIDFYALDLNKFANEYLSNSILMTSYLIAQKDYQQGLTLLTTSLDSVREQALNSDVLANLWIHIGTIYKELNQPNLAFEAYNKAETRSTNVENLEGLGKVYFNKFVLLKETEKNQYLNDLLFKSQNFFERSYSSENHPDLIAVRNSLAMRLTAQGDYLQADKIFEKLKDQVSKNTEKINYSNYINHANVKYYLGDFQLAIELTESALERMKELNLQSSFTEMAAKVIQARAMTELNQFGQANQSYQLAKDFFKETYEDDHKVMMTLNIYQTDHFLKSNQIEKALKLSIGIASFAEIQLNENPGTKNRYINSMTTLACLYSHLNQNEKALNYFKKAENVLKSNSKKQGWIYWVIQAGIEKSNFKLNNEYNDDNYKRAINNVFSQLDESSWYHQFFNLNHDTNKF